MSATKNINQTEGTMEKLTMINTGQRHRYGGKSTILHNEDKTVWLSFGFSWSGNNDGGYFSSNYGSGSCVVHLHIEVEGEERIVLVDEHINGIYNSNDAQKAGAKYVRENIRPFIKKAFNVVRSV